MKERDSIAMSLNERDSIAVSIAEAIPDQVESVSAAKAQV